jgi:hypothetical protein
MVRLAFDVTYEENYIGKKWLWQIPQIAEGTNHNCSLMVTELPKPLRVLFRKIKYLYLPCWVSGEIDISDDNPSFLKNSSLKSDLRRIRNHKLYFEVTHKQSKFHDFYYNMYVPYITKAYGNRSIIMSYDYLKREFKNGGLFNDLLLIKEDDKYIAGILLHYKKNRAKLIILGVKDGSFDYVKHGAIGALFYFSSRYLTEKGFTRIDFGKSRPFLKDGVLQYKKKWNQKISNKNEVGFLIKMISKTEAVKGFFLNNPLIYQDKTGLNGAIFVKSDQYLCKEVFIKIYKDYYIPGLSKLVIYQFGRTNGKIIDIDIPGFSGKIKVRSAESIFCNV